MTISQTTWKRNHDAVIRIQRGLDHWPCKQCGSDIRYSPKGGNKLTICLDCAPNTRFRMLVNRYGVDKAMFDAMYFEQDGECAIASCVREAKSVDHNHLTGLVRGLLCQGCNVAIGFMENNTWSNDAQNYLIGV